jgi:hypothetical protein
MNQSLSYAGVDAHHQNGIVEKRIRDLQDLTRSSLIHAIRRWPDAINTSLWPYALRKATRSYNHSTPPNQDRTIAEIFSGTKVAPNLGHEHPFGCPVYVRASTPGGKAPKWESRARLGIYLGTSEQHASNVSLVLSLATGLVSPQFHAKHDDDFYSTSLTADNIVPKSEWQEKCGFLDKPQRSTTKGPVVAPKDVYDEVISVHPVDNHHQTEGAVYDQLEHPETVPPEENVKRLTYHIQREKHPT